MSESFDSTPEGAPRNLSRRRILKFLTFIGAAGMAEGGESKRETENALMVMEQLQSLVSPSSNFCTVGKQFLLDSAGIDDVFGGVLNWVNFKIDREKNTYSFLTLEQLVEGWEYHRKLIIPEVLTSHLNEDLIHKNAIRVYPDSRGKSIEDGFSITFTYYSGGNVWMSIYFYDQPYVGTYIINGDNAENQGIQIDNFSKPLSKEQLENIKMKIIRKFAEAYFGIKYIRDHDTGIKVIQDPKDE